MAKRFLSYSSLNTDIASLFLRLAFGALFVYYGYLKIEGYDLYMPMMKDYIGLGGKLSYNLVIFAEFFCGFLVLIGFLTRLTVIPIFITMTVAYFIAHANDSFQIKNLAFVYFLLCPVIFILGSGKYSIDWLFFRNRQKSSQH